MGTLFELDFGRIEYWLLPNRTAPCIGATSRAVAREARMMNMVYFTQASV